MKKTDEVTLTQVNMKVPVDIHFDIRRLADQRNSNKRPGQPRTTLHEVYLDAIVAGLNVLEQ